MTAVQRVVVTGGASGIGAAAVSRLRSDGAMVAALDRDAEALARIEADLRIVADVTDAETLPPSIDEAAEQLGGLDALITCAGVAGRGTVADTSPEEWDRVFAINARGTYVTARAAIPHLRRSGGAIVTVASQLGVVAAANAAAYCASKGAVIMLTKAMAVDHGPEGIRVNCVCPGPTLTPLAEAYLDASPDPSAERRGYEAMQLHERMIEPDEIADAIAYLASPAAASTMGAVLVVDGGYTIR